MNIRKLFFRIYWKIQGIIVPTLRNSEYLYEDVLNSYVNPDIKWLDLGCGHQILPPWRLEEEKCLVANCKMIVGIDANEHSLRKNNSISLKVRGDISELPFENNSFNLVTANMVMEHLRDPDRPLREIHRILRPKGVFLFHTPNVLGYTTIMGRVVPKFLKNRVISLLQGRGTEDIFDAYYRGNSRRRISNLAEKTGFAVRDCRMTVSSAQFVVIPALVILELLWIRILMTKLFKALRTNIIGIYEKR